MKPINKKAAAILEKMRGMMENDYLKISNTEGYMPVVVERVGSIATGPYAGSELISVAHYGEQNGDLMRDPEVVFIRDRNGNYFPDGIRNDYMGTNHQVVTYDNSGHPVRFNPRGQRNIAVFCGQWMDNIRDQQRI